MANAKPQYTPKPRYFSRFQVATLLGMSEGTFDKKRDQLEKNGFPTYDDLFKGWDADAIEQWCNVRAGLGPVTAKSGQDAFMDLM